MPHIITPQLLGHLATGMAIKSYLKRFVFSLFGVGAFATVIKLGCVAVDHWFDLRYGLDTCSWADLKGLTINSKNKDSGVRYQPTRVLPLKKLLRTIQPMIPENPMLVDYGCGKGRVLLVASAFGFREVRGVEFAHELCEIARKNCARYKAKAGVNTEFRIAEADAASHPVSADENIFFLYNPFDVSVLNKVLDNVSASLRRTPRKIMIVYHNPKWAHVFDERADFVRLSDVSFWGYHFTVLTNRNGGSAD
jgi:SAM-dependent methyltransferase